MLTVFIIRFVSDFMVFRFFSNIDLASLTLLVNFSCSIFFISEAWNSLFGLNLNYVFLNFNGYKY